MVHVHRKVPCSTVVLGVVFFPGMNLISEPEFSLVEKHPGFISELKCGNMVMGGRTASDNSDAVDAIDNPEKRYAKIAQEVQSMKLAEAKKLVSETGDGFALRAIKKSDSRQEIQKAVDQRMLDIKGQKGSDLRPESRYAPEGTGDDFDSKITGTKADIEGNKAQTAIPMLKGNR
jgi:hypothetical protein